MKWLFRLFSVVLLLGALSTPIYLHYKKNGDQISISAIATDIGRSAKQAIDKLKGAFGQNTAGAEGSSSMGLEAAGEADNGDGNPSLTKLYQWQDESGQWHFSDTPPEDKGATGNVAQRVIDSKDVMTVPAISTSGSTGGLDNNKATSNGWSTTNQTDDVLSIENAVNVMDNAKAAAQQMEQRNQALKEIVGDK
jgi:Domain of unknown function (DUF4124)